LSCAAWLNVDQIGSTVTTGILSFGVLFEEWLQEDKEYELIITKMRCGWKMESERSVVRGEVGEIGRDQLRQDCWTK
jgi:aspartate/tyrosine/aromatic aminotransferase